MMKKTIFLLLALPIFSCTCHGQQESSSEELITQLAVDNLKIPNGFSLEVFHEGVGPARHVVVRDNGDVYIRLRNADPMGIVALRDGNQDGKAEITEYFDTIGGGTGIDIYKNYLYYSTDTAIYRKEFFGDRLVPYGEREVVVSNFPAQQSHAAKAFSINSNGQLFVNVGAPSNSCQEKDREPLSPGMNPCPLLENHAGIWLFSAEQLNQDFAQGKRYASGLRNIVAMDWNPYQNQLYVVQHGRDSLHDLFPSLYTEKQSAELPAEQFLALREGFVGSWPYAYWDHFKNVFVQSPEYGGDGEKTSDQYTPPLYGFPAHYAPNDLLFYKGEQFPEKYRKGTFVAFHGSWNRLGFEQKGYHVQFLPMEDGKPSGEAEIFISGFAGDKEITASSQARYRPMGLSMLNDGSLLIVDSKEGRIWKVTF